MDFLRANAVLVVFGYHVLAFFGIKRMGPFDLEAVGMFGVLSFFVHTSLVLMRSLERQVHKYGFRRLFLIFMARRCFRIYPLSIFIVAVILLFRLPLGGHPWALTWTSPSRWGIVSNFLLAQNITWSNSVEGPLWSLPFEVQMYLVLPVIFLLVRKSMSVWSLVAGWVLAVGVISIALRLGHAHPLTYVPCFLSGVIAYNSSKQVVPRWPGWWWPLFLWGLTALLALHYGIGIAWLICLPMGLMVSRFEDIKNPWICQISYRISKYSYGLYLSHYFCLWLAFTRLGFLTLGSQWIIFIVTAVALPVVLYNAIEQPSIDIGKKLVESRLAGPEMRTPARRAA